MVRFALALGICLPWSSPKKYSSMKNYPTNGQIVCFIHGFGSHYRCETRPLFVLQSGLLLSPSTRNFVYLEGGLASHGGAIGIVISTYLFDKNSLKRPDLGIWQTGHWCSGLWCHDSFGNLMNSEIMEVHYPALGFIFVRDIKYHPCILPKFMKPFIVWLPLASPIGSIGNVRPTNVPAWYSCIPYRYLPFSFFVEFIKNNQEVWRRYAP